MQCIEYSSVYLYQIRLTHQFQAAQIVVLSLRGGPGCGCALHYSYLSVITSSNLLPLVGIDAPWLRHNPNTNKRYLLYHLHFIRSLFTKHAPHGVRLPRTIKLYSLQMTKWMTAQDHIALSQLTLPSHFVCMFAELHVSALNSIQYLEYIETYCTVSL